MHFLHDQKLIIWEKYVNSLVLTFQHIFIYTYITLHYIILHLADAFIQSDLQFIHTYIFSLNKLVELVEAYI